MAVSLLSALVVLTTGTPAALGAADKLPEFTIRVGRDSSNDMGPSVMYDERLRAGDEDERSVQVRSCFGQDAPRSACGALLLFCVKIRKGKARCAFGTPSVSIPVSIWLPLPL